MPAIDRVFREGEELLNDVAGRLAMRAAWGQDTIEVGHQVLREGVLIGRYARCEGFGPCVDEGLSRALSPEPERQGRNFELSIAVAKSPTHPWAVALLRHLCRYQLSSGNELMVGDVMPCHAPITYIPFPPQHHASMPPTELDSIVVVGDPVLGAIGTPHGPIEVRRIVGVTMDELRVIGPEPVDQRGAILGETNPDFITVL